MLTPEGFKEKVRKSCDFTIRTIQYLKMIRDAIQTIIFEYYQHGARKLLIMGDEELVVLIEIALHDLSLEDLFCTRINENHCEGRGYIIFVSENGKQNKIDILDELSKRGVYY
jgi:hypothetical protein